MAKAQVAPIVVGGTKGGQTHIQLTEEKEVVSPSHVAEEEVEEEETVATLTAGDLVEAMETQGEDVVPLVNGVTVMVVETPLISIYVVEIGRGK